MMRDTLIHTLGAGTKIKVLADDDDVENKDDKAPVWGFSEERVPDTWPTV